MVNSRFLALAGQSIWLVLVVLYMCQPSHAETAPKLVRVPLYFVTDRNLQSNDPEKGPQFGPHRKYIAECQHDPFMGTGYCVVENKNNKQLTPNLISLGWAPAGEREKIGAVRLNLIEGKDFASIQNQFYSQLAASGEKSAHKNMLLFAHGYKNSFESAWHTAARFSYTYETPVVFYSWPSVAKLRSYSSDENNNEWSQEHFNDVLVELEKVCLSHPDLKLRVFAHSMGSRLVVRGTPLLRERPYVVEVALVCPDVDQGLVKHYARRYLSTKGTAKIRLYMSRRDKALAFSQILHGGYCRLGECADSIASLMTPAQAKTTAEDNADEKRLKELIEKTKHRMQTIDFTSLDSGLIGHQIPVELMDSMSFYDVPGDGLKLTTEQSGQRSRVSNAFSKMTRLKSDTIMSADSCFRVVRDSSTDKRVAAKPSK